MLFNKYNKINRNISMVVNLFKISVAQNISSKDVNNYELYSINILYVNSSLP